MPPKKSQTSGKSVEKQKKQIIEDKTFGLKNKNKSKKVQEFVSFVAKQADESAQKKKSAAGLDKNKEKAALMRKKKELMEMKKRELELLFKPVEKKSAKIDVYVDQRDQMGNEDDDTMDNWDLQKLESVIKQKHNQNNSTSIICKHFLKAIEDGKYGWFWLCPAGGDKCKYKHALPVGFVLKKKDFGDESKNIQSLEDFIEEERKKLPDKLTPVTEESFKKWKEHKLKMVAAAEEKQVKDMENRIAAGKAQGLSGRQLFSFVPQFQTFEEEEDEEAFDLSKYKQDQDRDEGIDESLFEGEDLDEIDIE
eukprot:NODE_310_length_11257_cov_0.344417.p3 type:complete len:308 gc:universal NODE_310_length_11257_cov_0.344417:7256-6333(-)